jgi:hypothetical protein
MAKFCSWCSTGKPHTVTIFKNPNCGNCSGKPDTIVVNGVVEKVKTTKEWRAFFKSKNFVDHTRLRAFKAKMRANALSSLPPKTR